MKKERYFRHELERMFIAYAIVPAVIFTLVCGMLFMTVLLHGKRSGNIEHNRYVAGLLTMCWPARGGLGGNGAARLL